MNFLRKLFKFDPEVDFQYALREDVNGNYTKAYWLYEKAANAGLSKAQFSCGYMCLHGRGTTKNVAAAINFLNKAAGQNYYKAQYLLFQMYMYGIGVTKDVRQASALLEKAQETGADLSKLSFLDLYEDFE